MTGLDQQALREALARAAGRPETPPLPLEQIIAAGTRRRHLRLAARAGGVGVLVAAVLAAAFWLPQRHGASPEPAHSGLRQTQQAPPPAGQAGSAPPCRATDLRLTPGTPGPPQTGEEAASFAVVNRSSSACTVLGVPRVSLLAADGTRLRFHYTRKSTTYLPVQHPEPVVLVPGGPPASLLVVKYRCDRGDGAHAVRIQVSVHGRTVTAPVVNADIAYCRGGSADPGQTVAVSAFTAASARQ